MNSLIYTALLNPFKADQDDGLKRWRARRNGLRTICEFNCRWTEGMFHQKAIIWNPFDVYYSQAVKRIVNNILSKRYNNVYIELFDRNWMFLFSN